MDTNLAATTRETRGKNEARRLRTTGRVPAVLYGGERRSSVAISIDPKPLLRILHSQSGVNTLIDLAVDDGASSQVLVKDLTLDPVTNALLHVDFYRLAMDKAIEVTVQVTLVGEATGVKVQGGMLDFVTREVELQCMPAEIPEHIEVDVSALEIGDGIRLRDVIEGVTWTPVSDLDLLLVHVTAPKVEEEPAEAEAAVEGAAEGAAEPEVAKKGKAEGEDAGGDKEG